MILGKCQFACVFSLLDLACMVLHVLLCCSGMDFAKCDSIFSLALPFLDSLDEMDSHNSFELYLWMDSKLGEVYLLNDKHMA